MATGVKSSPKKQLMVNNAQCKLDDAKTGGVKQLET